MREERKEGREGWEEMREKREGWGRGRGILFGFLFFSLDREGMKLK